MVIFSQCLDCKNYIGLSEKNKQRCRAFPEEIPEDIFWNKIIHDKEVKGDHGIIFDEIKK